MTGQANEQAAVNYPPPPATRPADADPAGTTLAIAEFVRDGDRARA